MAYTINSGKRYRGGKRCVAGGPNLVRLSMHLFPKQETDHQRRRKWVHFVHKHRPGFRDTVSSCLCSAHVEDSCFDMNLALAKTLNMKRRLKGDAIPTIYVAGIIQWPKNSRQVDHKDRLVL
jgi:hypothetical protein